MKFILNEKSDLHKVKSPKFILEERIKLTEDDLDLEGELLGTSQNSDPKDDLEGELLGQPEEKNSLPLLVEKEVLEKLAKKSEMDWDIYYKNCNSTEQLKNFWDGIQNLPIKSAQENADLKSLPDAVYEAMKEGYWKAEWKDQANKMKKVSDAFKEAVKSAGFNPVRNPLIYFFKNYMTKLNLSDTSYIFIHNLIADRVIPNLNVLRGPNNSPLKGADLLYNKNLYTLSTVEATELIKTQQQFIKKSDNAVIWANISLEAGNSTDLTDDTIKTSLGSTIREISDILNIMTQQFGELDTVEQATNKTVQKILNDYADPAKAKEVLSYLINQYRNEFKTVINKLDTSMNGALINLLKDTPLSYTQALNFDKLITAKFNAETFNQVVVGLCTILGLKVK